MLRRRGSGSVRSFASAGAGPAERSFFAHAAHQLLAPERIGGIAAPLVFLRRHVGHVAEPAMTTIGFFAVTMVAGSSDAASASAAGSLAPGCDNRRAGIAAACALRFRARFGRCAR